jgi:hypothetical protein
MKPKMRRKWDENGNFERHYCDDMSIRMAAPFPRTTPLHALPFIFAGGAAGALWRP